MNSEPKLSKEAEIYKLGGECAFCALNGDFPGLQKAIKRARELGVEIEDNSWDGVISKIAKRN